MSCQRQPSESTAFIRNEKQVYKLDSGIYLQTSMIWRFTPGSHQGLTLGSCPLVAAIWAFVVLDVLGTCRRDLDTLPMVPPLTTITTDPEFVLAVICSAGST